MARKGLHLFHHWIARTNDWNTSLPSLDQHERESLCLARQDEHVRCGIDVTQRLRLWLEAYHAASRVLGFISQKFGLLAPPQQDQRMIWQVAHGLHCYISPLPRIESANIQSDFRIWLDSQFGPLRLATFSGTDPLNIRSIVQHAHAREFSHALRKGRHAITANGSQKVGFRLCDRVDQLRWSGPAVMSALNHGHIVLAKIQTLEPPIEDHVERVWDDRSLDDVFIDRIVIGRVNGHPINLVHLRIRADDPNIPNPK